MMSRISRREAFAVCGLSAVLLTIVVLAVFRVGSEGRDAARRDALALFRGALEEAYRLDAGYPERLPFGAIPSDIPDPRQYMYIRLRPEAYALGVCLEGVRGRAEAVSVCPDGLQCAPEKQYCVSEGLEESG